MIPFVLQITEPSVTGETLWDLHRTLIKAHEEGTPLLIGPGVELVWTGQCVITDDWCDTHNSATTTDGDIKCIAAGFTRTTDRRQYLADLLDAEEEAGR